MFNIKSIIYSALATAVIALCCAEVAYIYKKVRTEQGVQLASQEKKARLDNYYLCELKSAWTKSLHPKYSIEAQMRGFDTLEKTESHMLQDGYDRHEIQVLSFKAQDAAEQKLDDKYPLI